MQWPRTKRKRETRSETLAIHERAASLFIQCYESNLGILRRGARYYPYIEGTATNTTAFIEEIGQGQQDLPIAFARRDEMGWETGALRTDDEGYLYSLDLQISIRWLETWIANHAELRLV